MTLAIKKQVGHQGDVQWFSLAKLPKGAKKVQKQFIAASEKTGSFHALFGNYDMYELEDGFAVDVKEDCILNHSLKEHVQGISMDQVKELPKKDHRHSVVKKGLYYVGIQNKFNPMSGFLERVKD